MPHLIQLSLTGNGRLVILTPQTVRKAFFQFTKVNSEYTGREKHRLDSPIHNSKTEHKLERKKQQIPTINDALHRYGDRPSLLYLDSQDILKIERQINRYIINYDLALVENEGQLFTGYDIHQQVGKNRQKIKYILRYGMFFIVEPISRQEVFKKRNIDLFIQEAETFDFHLVRFYGVLLSSLKSKIQLSFSHRLDYSLTWTQTLEKFKPRQIFRVTKIYPCSGFRILNVF